VRFDGVRFVPWNPPNGESLLASNIYALRGSSDGGLWIGTDRNGLWNWNAGLLTRYTVPGVINEIREIRENGKESIWIAVIGLLGEAGSVCEVDQGKLRCYGPPNGIPPRCCNSLATDDTGNFWMGTDAAIVRWKPRSSTVDITLVAGTDVTPSEIMDFVSMADGSTWIGNGYPGIRRGLQHFVNGTWRPQITADWNSSSVGIRSLLRDRHDTLWVGTTGRGIYRIRDGKVDHFGSADGLSGDAVNKMIEDREGNMWVTTVSGIDCFRDLAVATFSSREGLSARTSDTVMASRNGTVWTGGENGLDALLKEQISSLRTGHGLPGGQVTSLLEDHDGRLWVGIDQTMSILKDGRFNQIKRPDGRPLGFVVGLAEDSDNNIWAEIRGVPRELLRIHDLHVDRVFPAPEMPAARKVAADPGGGIWLGLMSGDIARYRRGKLETFHFQHEVDSLVNQIDVNQDGSVFGATQFGLIGWRTGKQQILTTKNGLPCDSINALVWDAVGALWLYTQCGLVEIAGQEIRKWWRNDSATLRMRVFDTFDGAQAGLADFQGAARSNEGKLWFVNSSVLQMIDPLHLPVNTILPPVHVEDVMVNGKTLSPTNDLHLAALTRDIAIRYTALSFVAPQKVRFRYMLEGQDKTWQEAGTRREAFYTNLAPRSYRFRVIACNNDGLWNEAGATWSFQIAPAYYQTSWFKLLCIGAGLVLCWLLYLLRLKQATAQMQARLSERLRIARELHDTLLQGFNGLVLRFEAVMKKMASDDPARELMGKALERADEVLLEGRLRVRDLRSELPPAGDLAQALAECGEELSKQSTISFSLTVHGSPQPLDLNAFDEVYQIGREALHNAFSHSRASKIEMEIFYEQAVLRLRVRDDGAGIDPKTLNGGRRGHWGLSGIRERARTLGATLNIRSTPGAGTEIDLNVPAKVALLKNPGTIRWRRIQEAVYGGRLRK
jgi:signal transduction histidine kinase/ligand-binding sensor domain-containing protein